MSFDIQEKVTLRGTITFTVDAENKKAYATIFKNAATEAAEDGLTELAKEFTSVAKKLGGRGRPKGSTNKATTTTPKAAGGKKRISIEATDEATPEGVAAQKKPIRIKAVKIEEVLENTVEDEYDEYVPISETSDESSEEEFDEFA